LGEESVELERSLNRLDEVRRQAEQLQRRLEEERRRREEPFYAYHYTGKDRTGEILLFGSHVTTSHFTSAAAAKMATGAYSACWRCNAGGPRKAFKELPMTPGYATDFEVILPGVVLVYQCAKMDP
jgi:hypothetical protein